MPLPFPDKFFSRFLIRKLPVPFPRSESPDLFSVTINMFVGIIDLKVTVIVQRALTNAAKITTKNTFQKELIVLAQLICKNYKTISLQSKFSRKQGQTTGGNITKKMFW